MPRILAFTSGPQDWRTLLAQPDKQWRTGFSARTLAHCWEGADGFPSEVARAFSSAASDPLLANLVPVLAVPEFKVPLPGGRRASQNDIFVLAKSRAGPVAMMVEGKVKETFGPTILDWLVDASSGKQRRLEYLAETIGLAALPPSNIRYQLLHRAASAVIVGEQFRAAAAVLLVHTFSIDRAGWSDYQAFVRLFSIDAVVDEVQRLPGASKIPLYAAWVTGNLEFLAR